MGSDGAKVTSLKSTRSEMVLLLCGCFVTGVFIDFIFNGVAVKILSSQAFTEAWFFIYVPVFLTIAATLSTLISQSAWRRFTKTGTIAILAGMVAGHLTLIGHHTNHVYKMALVAESPTILLRSDEWPQILFVRGSRVQDALFNQPVKDSIPVTMEVITDYGCIRSSIVSNVAGIDVKNDGNSEWVWRLNKFATTAEKDGPGMEDLILPWCKHRPEIKMIEGGPDYWRPWDDLLQKIGPKISHPGTN